MSADPPPTPPGLGPNLLAGYRIVDLATVVAGPYATQIMGDLGADVIKVEGPDGDLMRGAGRGVNRDMGPIYLTLNRNKRSLVLDLKQKPAVDVLAKLVSGADVFFTNVRPQGLARLGLDYEGVRAMCEKIIYVHLVGYGSDGPYSGRQAYDDLVQAASGLSDLSPKTERGGEPRFVPSLVADKLTGLHAVYATLAALLHRERTGQGQFVEVPMLEATVSFNLAEHLYGQIHQPATGQWGYTRVLTPNRRPFATRDSHIAIMPYTDKHWPMFFDVAGHPERWDRWRMASITDRTEHIDELYAMIGEVTQEKTTAEWMLLLDKANIPCMRVNRLEDLPEDPHLKETGFFESREHPTEGRYRAMRHPVRFGAAETSIRHEPPRHGQDSRDLLTELGVSSTDTERLIETGAVGVVAAKEDEAAD